MCTFRFDELSIHAIINAPRFRDAHAEHTRDMDSLLVEWGGGGEPNNIIPLPTQLGIGFSLAQPKSLGLRG